MNKKDKKLQEDLVNEMMKVSETNPDVIIYMQSLMKCYEELEQENQQLKKQKDDVVEYIKKHFQDNEGIICKYVGDKECEINENFINEILRMLGEIDD